MQVLPLLVALVALNVQAAAAQNPQEQSELCIFTRTKLESFLSRETGCQTVHVRDVQRSGDASKLHVIFGCSAGTNDSVAIVGSDGRVQVKELPGRRTVLDDYDEPVCWVGNHLFHVVGQSDRKIDLHTRFVVAPGGRFLCFRRAPGQTKLIQTSATSLGELELPANFYATSLFEGPAGLSLFGSVSNRVVGLVIASDKTGLRIAEQIDLSWAGAVRDMDPVSGTLLVEEKSDMFPKWFLYKVPDKSRKALGAGKEFAVFLRPTTASAVRKSLK